MTIALTITNLASPATLVNAADVTSPDAELLAYINNLLNGTQAFDAQLWTNSTATLATDTLSLASKPRVLVVDTEAAGATDDLSTISNGTAYQQLWIKAANAGRVITVKHNVGNIKLNGSADVTLSSTAWLLLFYDGTQWTDVFIPASTVPSQVCNARLTLTSGTAVTTSDVTAATSVYMTPYKGNRISLYNGTSWITYSFSEITISLTGFTADKNYDVFAYVSSGTVVTETVVWTNDTTRATAITLQDGVYVKSGTTSKRYVGTFRTTSTIGQCEDSISKRYVWNMDNRVTRQLQVTDTTDSWTYATNTWRSWNNSTNNRVSFVMGVAEGAVSLEFWGGGVHSTTGAFALGIGLDSTSSPSGTYQRVKQTTDAALGAAYAGVPAAGFHYLQLLEITTGATATFYGDNGGTLQQAGAVGTMAA